MENSKFLDNFMTLNYKGKPEGSLTFKKDYFFSIVFDLISIHLLNRFMTGINFSRITRCVIGPVAR